MEIFSGIMYAVVLCLLGGLVGVGMVLWSASVLPRFLDRMTPNIDESKELVRGNRAVADYYGRVSAAAILGVSIVAAAAVLGGIIAALH